MYIPLINEGLLTFFHETLQLVFPPGITFTMRWAPPARMVYLVFFLTMGRARDYVTGDTITSTDYGFYHRGGLGSFIKKTDAMRWHWDPMVESIFLVEYPHHLVATHNKAMILELYNNAVDPITGLPITVVQDFSIWVFECNEEEFKDVEQYFRGYYNYYHTLGGMSKQQLERFLLKTERR